MSTSQLFRIAGRWSISKWHGEGDWWKPLQLTLHCELEDYCDNFIYQLEWTDCKDTYKCGNYHFQIYMRLKKKRRLHEQAALFTELPGIYLQPASTEGNKALQKYCMKTDTRYAGPWADRRIYMGEDLPRVLDGWQTEMLAIYESAPDDRKVMWVNNEEGNAGKSKFCKWMCFRKDCLKLSYGKAGDLLNLVAKNQGKRMYLFDLTRCKPAEMSSADLYAAIESVKDGHFSNLKYETATVMMDPCHCVVFANSWPDVRSLSADRWAFYELGARVDGKCAQLKLRTGLDKI